MPLLLLACLVALMTGIVAARLMRVAGLVLVLGMLAACAIAALLLDLPRPSWPQLVLLLAVVQAGYLLGALVLPAHRPAATPALPSAKDDRAAG